MNNTATTTITARPDYVSENGITETEALNALEVLGGAATAGEVVRVALELRAAAVTITQEVK